MNYSDDMDNAFIEIQELTYGLILSNCPDFVGLDISVDATGWVKWHGGKLTAGIEHLKSKEDLDRRIEFKRFLLNLYGDSEFECTIIEDVIGGVNFKTMKSLIQLNSIADDLKAEGVIKTGEILRENNSTWKRRLKEMSGLTLKNTKDMVKLNVCMCMVSLCFNDDIIKALLIERGVTSDRLLNSNTLEYYKTCSPSAKEAPLQGIYDALGMSLATLVFRAQGNTDTKDAGLHTDIMKGYKIEQFDDVYEASDCATKIGWNIIDLDMTLMKRDIKHNFKSAVVEKGERNVFLITTPVDKLGVLALKKNLDVSQDLTYLVVYRR